jgi:5-methylcytosine-specific restriction endonuclease McrA
LTLDHVIPRSRGGESVWENVVTACGPCNLRKGNRLLEETELILKRPPRPPAPVLFIHLATPTIPSLWQRYLPRGSSAAA